ncbi:MAG: hypothetical protein O9327_05010 [Polaromonas sp.]|nr:hypothetical protein [Polaromonas sp.]
MSAAIAADSSLRARVHQPDHAQVAAEERALGTVPTPEERADDAIYQGLAHSRKLISLGRLSLGAQLVDVRDRDLWRGRCSGKTFRAFLLEEGIDPRSACQYMQVVRCFIQTYLFDIHELSGVGVSLLHEASQHLTALEIDRLALASPDRTATLKKLKSADGFGPQPLPPADEDMREAIAEVVLAMQRMAKAEARALLNDRIEAWRHHMGLCETSTATASPHAAPVATILGQVDALTLEQRSDLFRLLGRRPAKEQTPASATASPAPTSAVEPARKAQPVQAPRLTAEASTDEATPFWRRGVSPGARP